VLPQLLCERRPERERPRPGLRLRRVGPTAHDRLANAQERPPGSARSTSRQRSPRISPRRSPAPTTVRKIVRACSRQRRSSPSASSISSPKARSTRPTSTGLRIAHLRRGSRERSTDATGFDRTRPLPKRRAQQPVEKVQPLPGCPGAQPSGLHGERGHGTRETPPIRPRLEIGTSRRPSQVEDEVQSPRRCARDDRGRSWSP
jgi:hypothetical protein